MKTKQLITATMIALTLMLGACATRTDTRPVYVEVEERPFVGFVENVYANESEKKQNVNDHITVKVRLDSGARVTYTQDTPRDFRSGDRVRIEGGRVYRS